jgi:hypothetical protein
MHVYKKYDDTYTGYSEACVWIHFFFLKKITWIYVNFQLLLIRKLYTIIRVTTTF